MVTCAAQLLFALSGKLDLAVFTAGFIPARVDGAQLPPELFAVPVVLTPLSATLVHAGLLHLGMNMVMLLFVGRLTEQVVGWRPMVLLYVAGAYAAAAGQWIATGWIPEGWIGAQPPEVPMVGASGAISALFGLSALLYGARRARAFGPFSAVTVQALWLAAAWSVLNLMVSLVWPIAWAAHVGGFLAGLLLARPLLAWRWRSA